MVANIIGGAALIGVGAVGNYFAGRSRERAFNAALDARRQDVAGFDAARQESLDSFQRQLGPLSEQTTQNSINALQGITQASTEVFEGAQAQGLQDISAGTAEVFGQAPIGQDFAPGFGAGARALTNAQNEMAPLQGALTDLSASGLGRLAQNQALGDVSRENILATQGVQDQLGIVQEGQALRQGRTGLEDLKSNLAFQRATTAAGDKGVSLQAFSGLAQQLGGGLISSGQTVRAT